MADQAAFQVGAFAFDAMDAILESRTAVLITCAVSKRMWQTKWNRRASTGRGHNLGHSRKETHTGS
jgi:hypothetical protein